MYWKDENNKEEAGNGRCYKKLPFQNASPERAPGRMRASARRDLPHGVRPRAQVRHVHVQCDREPDL